MSKLDRRRFVVSASALSAGVLLSGCPGPSMSDAGPGDGEGDGGVDGMDPEDMVPVGPGPEPDEAWAPPGDIDAASFPLGIQSGDAHSDSVIISVQTELESVDIALARAGDEGWDELARVTDVPVTDGFAQIEVVDLFPEFTYNVVAYEAGGDARSSVARFRTAPAADGSAVIRFGSTSCLGGNEPWPSLSAVGNEKLDFVALLGDTVYLDNVADADVNAYWAEKMGVAGLRDACAGSSIVATWDDHEVDNNFDIEAVGPRFELCRNAFRRFLPQRVGTDDAIWRQLSYGQTLDVFVLDCRGERREGNYISPAQMDWLKAGLSSSTARFKIILNSVPIIDFSDLPLGLGNISSEDRWQGFPEQRSELLGYITDNTIAGVLFITGDFHVGGWARVDPAGGVANGLYEVLTGPGGSAINPGAGFIEENDRYEAVVTEHNSVIFTCDPDAGTIGVDFIGDGGTSIRSTTLEL